MLARYATARRTEPGEAIVGEWAHVKYSGHHLVRERGHYDRRSHMWSKRLRRWIDFPHVVWNPREVTTACGRGYPRESVWHDPPLPHLPRCKTCARAAQGLHGGENGARDGCRDDTAAPVGGR